MLRKPHALKKINIPAFLDKHRKDIIAATIAIISIAIVVLIMTNNNITNVDSENITNDDIENETGWSENTLLNEQIESNEQIIYIAPEDLYVDENVTISVTSHVDNQLYGQGIRFDYRNKSLNEVEIMVAPVEANETLDDNKTIVEPGTIKTHVLYIGLDAKPFTEENYSFTITTGESSYMTEVIPIKAK